MAEADFQTELTRGFEERGGFSYKIPDTPPKIAKLMRFVPMKPFDCVWLYEGIFFGVECKQERGLSFNIGDNSRLAPHQQEQLMVVEQSGGVGALVIHFHSTLSEKQAAFRGCTMMDRAFAVRWRRILRDRVKFAKDALDIDWLARNAVELPLIVVQRRDKEDRLKKHRAWDPKPLLEL